MGRIKTQLTKRITLNLMEQHGEEVSSDFEENKKIVRQFTTVTSPRIRNTIAGYVTRLAKKK